MYIDDLRRIAELAGGLLASEERKECCKEEAKKREEEKTNEETFLFAERKYLKALSAKLVKDTAHEAILFERVRCFMNLALAPMTFSSGLAFQDISNKLIDIYIKNRETKTAIRACEERIEHLKGLDAHNREGRKIHSKW